MGSFYPSQPASIFSDTYHCTASASKDAEVIECQRSVVSELLSIGAADEWILAVQIETSVN